MIYDFLFGKEIRKTTDVVLYVCQMAKTKKFNAWKIFSLAKQGAIEIWRISNWCNRIGTG